MRRVDAWRWLVVACCTVLVVSAQQVNAAPQHDAESGADESAFSARASAIPFPPDARELAFDAAFDDIEFTSRSSLASLVHFYRQEMTKRGWQEVQASATIDDEEVELTFKHGNVQVDMEFDLGSDSEIDVSFDCEGVDFTGTDDPTALIAAGVPQPRSYVYLQKNIQLPADVRDLEYDDDECMFKSRMELQPAFDHFSAMITKLGFRESRRPIVTDDRRYTGFQRGPIELSLNIFTHDYGTRLIIGYENSQPESRVASLPPGPALAKGSAAMANTDAASSGVAASAGGSANSGATASAKERPTGTPIDVSSNKGQVVVSHGPNKYTFRNVAAFQTQYFGDDRTFLVFSSKPIPLKEMQTMIVENEDFSFGDLFEFDLPDFISIQLGEYPGFSFTVPGVGIGRGIENPEIDLKIEQGRAQATVKMAPEEIFDKPFSFEATADAAVMTPHTRVANFTDPPAAAPVGSAMGEPHLPLPEGATDSYSEGTSYRRVTHAKVAAPVEEIADFYRKKFPAPQWREEKQAGDSSNAAGTASGTLLFRNANRSIVVDITPGAGGNAVDIASRDDAKARRDGLLPEPGKGRLVMGNSHSQTVVISIGKQNYTLRPGRGAEDPKSALNYSVTPGTYTLVIKIPGEQPQEEKVPIRPDTTWGVIALPTSGYMAMQLY